MGKLKELEVYDNEKIVLSIDETGIGSGVAHAVVSCVILPKETEEMKKEYLWRAIRDSKKIKKKEKIEELEEYIKKIAIYYDSYDVSLEDIESMNVYHAKVKGFRILIERALEKIPEIDIVLIDGNDCKVLPKGVECKYIVKGDDKYKSIAAASIISKCKRDRDILELHKEFPQYNWDKNKGYIHPTHIEALRKYGKCKYHRAKYVRNYI
jgi:ribonuclease HII